MDFNTSVNELEASHGVRIPQASRAVADKIFQAYKNLLVSDEGPLSILRRASQDLVDNLESDVEENVLDWDEFYLDRAFLELRELDRDLDSQRSFYLPHVRKEYSCLKEKWNEFLNKWLPPSNESYGKMQNRVGYLNHLRSMVTSLTPIQNDITVGASEILTIIDQLKMTFHDDYRQNLVVSPKMIIELASSSTGIPHSHISRQLNLSPKIAETHPFFVTLIGLDHIVSFIMEVISNRKPFECPLGSFLLLGRSGCGRTELARALAKHLFDSEDFLVLCDMSDYQDANSEQRFRVDLCGKTLLGKLIDVSLSNAHGILMFANMEKAHPSVCKMTFSILNEGIIKNCEGTVIDLSAVLILMKSNYKNDPEKMLCHSCSIANWKVKQILCGNQQLRTDHRHNCYYMSFLENTSRLLGREFIDCLDEMLVFPNLSPLNYSELARMQLRKSIPDMLSPMQKKNVVYLSQASLLVNNCMGSLIDNGGHASKEWLKKIVCPELQKSCGDGIGDLSVVYVDKLVGTRQLSCRIESLEHLLNDQIYGKFRKSIKDMRKVHSRNKKHVNMIYQLEKHAHDVLHHSELMQRIIDELLKESSDMENLEFTGEDECQQQMSIQKKAKHDSTDPSSKLCYEFSESNQATRIIKTLLGSMNVHFHRPCSYLLLGLHDGGREELLAGLSKCHFPDTSVCAVIEVDLAYCNKLNSLSRCICKGGDGELFFNAVRARPRSIILFHGIESTHVSVYGDILAILEHGFLHGDDGANISFHDSVILFVSECGNREVISGLFGAEGDKFIDTREGPAFRSELLYRLEEIIFFFPFMKRQFKVVQRLPIRPGGVTVKNRLASDLNLLFYFENRTKNWKMGPISNLKKMLIKIQGV